MTTTSRRKAALFTGGLLALACGVPAQAQFGGGGMGGRHGGARNSDSGTSRDSDAARGISPAEALYELRMRLLITPEQTPAWERFYRAYLGWIALAGRQAVTPVQAGGALLSVQQQLTLAQNRFAATEDLAESLKALFPSFTEMQQQTADDLVPRLLALTSPSGQHVIAR